MRAFLRVLCIPASYARLLCSQVSLRSPVGVLPVFEELVLPLPLPGALQSGRPGPSEAVPRVARRPMCVVSAGCTPVAGGVAVRWSAVAPGPGVARRALWRGRSRVQRCTVRRPRVFFFGRWVPPRMRVRGYVLRGPEALAIARVGQPGVGSSLSL